MYKRLERLAVMTAVPGALIIAANEPWSKYGFIFFLVSNVFAITLFALEKRHWFLAQTLIYTCINLFGAYRWLMAA